MINASNLCITPISSHLSNQRYTNKHQQKNTTNTTLSRFYRLLKSDF
ncbi:hypothetical protein [Helicobacter sp. T3_23-1056]